MKIAILSNGNINYSTLRLKEEAEKKGHTVKVIKYKNCYVAIEKDAGVKYRGKSVIGYDAIIPRIASHMTNYGTSIVRQLENQGIFTTASSIAIVRARDKLRSAQILAKHGVAIPKTVFSRNTTDIDQLIEEVGGVPVIIKLARGTHGNGVVLAETKKTAKSALQALYLMNRDGTNILIQEFVKESAGTDIRAFVVGSEVVAAYQRKSLDDDFRSNLHKGGEGTPIKLTEKEKRTAIKAAKVMGLEIAGVDMMRSKAGPLVIEVNASPGFGIEKITGINVAEKIIEFVEKNANKNIKKDRVGQ